MQLSVHLFEDQAIQVALQPLTQHRNVADLWTGMSTLESKWSRRVSNANQADIQVLSAILPLPSTFEILDQLPQDSSYVYEGQILAKRGDGTHHIEQHLPFLQHPEDLLAYQA
jgi:hypothetical protein